MNEARQQDEIESLRSIYGDIYKDLTSKSKVWNKNPSPHFQILLSSHINPDRPIVSLVLDIQFTPTYPTSAPLVKVLEPKNLLKARLALIENKVNEVIKEYQGEEVCFTMIMDVKEMLDDFQQTTEEVLSLEEERAKRIEQQRKQLEKVEQEQLQREQSAQRKREHEMTRQLQKLRGDYPESRDNTNRSFSQSSRGGDDEGIEESEKESLVPQGPIDNVFVFENTIHGICSQTRSKFEFRAVQGFVPYKANNLLSSISTQFVVTPYVPQAVLRQIRGGRLDVCYLFHVIELDDEYWSTNEGKNEIRELERQLEQAMNLNITEVLNVYGFQIDQDVNNLSEWTIRILTEFPPSMQTLDEVLQMSDAVNWALARSWLISILPTLELLHELSLPHCLLCPLSVVLAQTHDTEDSTPRKVLKLCHPRYGYTALQMYYKSSSFVNKFIPKNWLDPDPSAGLIKSDIWDLGVLFCRAMLGYNILSTEFKTPESFLRDFDVAVYQGYEEYAERVHDMLSKMLQPKASKRLSLMELNAVKFFRAGIDMNAQATVYGGPDDEEDSESDDDSVDHSRHHSVFFDTSRRNLAPPANNTRRRYSNNNPTLMMPNHESVSSVNKDSRYVSEFEEVGKLGKGGFGEVVKARNRMEGTFYAIKKIRHRADKLEGLLSEVLSLARLNHQYIVRYYGCWVEADPDQTVSIDSDDDSLEKDAESGSLFAGDLNVRSSSFLSRENSFQVDYFTNSLDPSLEYNDDDFDDRIVFANSTDENDDTSENDNDNAVADTSDEESDDTMDENRLQKTQPKTTLNQKSILYIQMEFCENNTLMDIIDRGLPGNPSEYWRLFRQILEAVSYIHSSGFIHRDLKPTNIFIDKSNNVKVGDFGLAKNSRYYSLISTNNQVAPAEKKDLSTVVGTFFYTANEVASGDYNEKVDMYSLGIIFFEMCYKLGTGMERAMTLNNIRLESVQFPANFLGPNHSTERTIVRRLLDHDPNKRPGATELLQSGLLPVEHQDEVIKEALKSLADPASPWQQQVRESLFNQPYSLARDMMFDKLGKNSHGRTLDHSDNDYLIFNATLDELFRIFDNHGAIRDFDGTYLLPKSSFNKMDQVYEILDRSGSVLTLAYDLVLPMARFLSKNDLSIPKFSRHEFVYRPNLRGIGTPDKYSAVGFDVFSHDKRSLVKDSAECIKVVDEILDTFPCFKTKNAQTVILINHSTILNACIDYAFGGTIKPTLSKRHEIMGVISSLMVERGSEEVKAHLRTEFKIQHTVIKDLIDHFDFTEEPEIAKKKLRKVFMDSPLLTKVEKAIQEIGDILSILRKFGLKASVLLCPLSNYNAKYYDGGIMFQAIHRIDKSRKFSRVATGGRYDRLIDSMSSEGIATTRTPHAVGFQLTSTLLFLLMKNSLKRTKPNTAMGRSMLRWRKARCDVLITSPQEAIMKDSGYSLLRILWSHNISCDTFVSSFQDDVLQKATEDGCNWIVVIKQSHQNKKTKRSSFKPIRVKNITDKKDHDLDFDEVLEFLQSEIDERRSEAHSAGSARSQDEREDQNSSRVGQPLFSVDLSHRVTIVPNDAPRGRKNNKREKWEVENDAKVAAASMMKDLADASVISVDLNDSTLDMISSTSLSVPLEEWFKKLFFTNKNLPKNYASNLYDSLWKERSKGTQWAILYNSKSDKTTIVDLQR
ncbi:hypothetical protein FDK38_004209 [Candidozyma auris]|nr:hypothetical protein FDK38_004209 [[Candida] auris]